MQGTLQACRELSDPCQKFWRRKVGRETRKTDRRSSGPGQRAAAAQAGCRGDTAVRSWQTGGGEGGHVGREATKLLRQVTSESQNGRTELGQLGVLDARF